LPARAMFTLCNVLRADQNRVAPRLTAITKRVISSTCHKMNAFR
jgi:hypothetical protein